MYLRGRDLMRSNGALKEQQNAEGWKLIGQAAELGDQDAMSWYVGDLATMDTATLVGWGHVVDLPRAQRYLDSLTKSGYQSQYGNFAESAVEWADDLARKRAGANDPEFDRYTEQK